MPPIRPGIIPRLTDYQRNPEHAEIHRCLLPGAVASLALLSTASEARHQADGKDKPPAIPAISERVAPVRRREGNLGPPVTLVATPDRIVHLDATARRTSPTGKPMRPDAIFWIASMTKPVTATAVLMLQDEGKLSVDDPVEKHLPEFKDLKTADGKPAQGHDPPPAHAHLGHGRDLARRGPRASRTWPALIPLYVAKPVRFEPGSKWAYCQSGINTAARIVEVVSGESFDRFVERRLFGPLGMKDTTFYLTEEQLPRLAKSYRRTDEGELEATRHPHPRTASRPTSRDRFPAAERRPLLHRPGLRTLLPDDPERRRARREALPEAGVGQADDRRPDGRPEDRLHRRATAGAWAGASSASRRG